MANKYWNKQSTPEYYGNGANTKKPAAMASKKGVYAAEKKKGK